MTVERGTQSLTRGAASGIGSARGRGWYTLLKEELAATIQWQRYDLLPHAGGRFNPEGEAAALRRRGSSARRAGHPQRAHLDVACTRCRRR